MTIRKFHIYLVNLDTQFGTEPGKIRPAVVVQTNLLNPVHPSTIICPITSQVIRESAILRVHLSQKENGLDKDLDILVDQIRAIDNRRFIREIGRLTKTQAAALRENLSILIIED